VCFEIYKNFITFKNSDFIACMKFRFDRNQINGIHCKNIYAIKRHVQDLQVTVTITAIERSDICCIQEWLLCKYNNEYSS